MSSTIIGTCVNALTPKIAKTYQAMFGDPKENSYQHGLEKKVFQPRAGGQYEVMESPHLSYLFYLLFSKINQQNPIQEEINSFLSRIKQSEASFNEKNSQKNDILREFCLNASIKGSHTRKIFISGDTKTDTPLFDGSIILSVTNEPCGENHSALIQNGDHHVINGNSMHDEIVFEQLVRACGGGATNEEIQRIVAQYIEDDPLDFAAPKGKARQFLKEEIGAESIWAAQKKDTNAGKTQFSTEVWAVDNALIPYNWLSAPEQLIVKAALGGYKEVVTYLIHLYGRNISEKKSPELLDRLRGAKTESADDAIYLLNKDELLNKLTLPERVDLPRLVGDKSIGCVNQIILNQLDSRSEFHAQHMAFHIPEDESLQTVLEQLKANEVQIIPAPGRKYYDEFIPYRLAVFMAFSITLSKNQVFLSQSDTFLIELFEWSKQSWSADDNESLDHQFVTFRECCSNFNINETVRDEFYLLFDDLRQFFINELMKGSTSIFHHFTPTEIQFQKLMKMSEKLKSLIADSKAGGYLLDIQVYKDNTGEVRVGLLEQTFTVAYGQIEEGRRTGFFELIKRHCLSQDDEFLDFLTGENLEKVRACGLFGFGNFPFLMKGIDDENEKAAKPNVESIQSLYWAKDSKDDFILPDPNLEEPFNVEAFYSLWIKAAENCNLIRGNDNGYYNILAALTAMLLNCRPLIIDEVQDRDNSLSFGEFSELMHEKKTK